jgi:hypothetical protein
MSIASNGGEEAPRWLPTGELRALGYVPGGPETDYGLRWGESEDVRVSFAPHRNRPGGFLYAHDPRTDRCLLLAAQTTREQVDTAWHQLITESTAPDGYLALAALDQPPAAMSNEQARELLLHCLDRELRAYHQFVTADVCEPTRFATAFTAVVHRATRVSAEQLLIEAARDQSPGTGPVIVRYRLLDEPGWTGRVAGPDLPAAVATTEHAVHLADRHHVTMQATSVTHGQTTLAAARVPELAFAVPRPTLAVDAVSLGI